MMNHLGYHKYELAWFAIGVVGFCYLSASNIYLTSFPLWFPVVGVFVFLILPVAIYIRRIR